MDGRLSTTAACLGSVDYCNVHICNTCTQKKKKRKKEGEWVGGCRLIERYLLCRCACNFFKQSPLPDGDDDKCPFEPQWTNEVVYLTTQVIMLYKGRRWQVGRAERESEGKWLWFGVVAKVKPKSKYSGGDDHIHLDKSRDRKVHNTHPSIHCELSHWEYNIYIHLLSIINQKG